MRYPNRRYASIYVIRRLDQRLRENRAPVVDLQGIILGR
ncbi:hypothetical protein BDFB_015337, partial [Asbolus verrucosus]